MALAFPTQLRYGHWGLVAQQTIQPGTIVCDETPLVSVVLDTLHSEWSDDDKVRFYASEYKDDTRHIKRALSKVSKDQQELFRRLMTNSGRWRRDRLDISRFELYARILSDAPQGNDGLTCIAVLYNVGHINHSCRPNAVFSWDGERAVVRATNAIATGEEILLDRLPEGLQCAEARIRKAYLLQQYAFDCQCCDCHASTFQEGDEIRLRLQNLHAALSGFVGNDAASTDLKTQIKAVSCYLAFASEYFGLIRQLGWQDMRLVGAHNVLAEALQLSGHISCARDHATRAIVVATRNHGAEWSSAMLKAVGILQQCVQVD